MIGDPFLNYFALFLLFFVVVVIFYAIIAIHDIPHIIAKSRNHPHQDAIHAAGWVSLFTLHAIWPFLWIWAMAYRPDRGWGFSVAPAGLPEQPSTLADELADLRRRIAMLEGRTAPEPGSTTATAPPAPSMVVSTPRAADSPASPINEASNAVRETAQDARGG